jgi:hypothetical protein
VVNKINGFWIPACAGMTDFLRFLTFFNTLLDGAEAALCKRAALYLSDMTGRT